MYSINCSVQVGNILIFTRDVVRYNLYYKPVQSGMYMYIDTVFSPEFFRLKAPDRCAQLFDRERSLITDKHTEVLDCISYVMVFCLALGMPSPYIDHSAACT